MFGLTPVPKSSENMTSSAGENFEIFVVGNTMRAGFGRAVL